jgi:hypothetical protein
MTALHKSLMRLKFFASLVLVTDCLLLAGCSTRTMSRSQEHADGAQLHEASQPDLLYLLASPHSRIHVEVDAVQGCVPKERALQQLQDFLSAYCHKPDGVEIVRSDVIPIADARGISPRALARKFINGPDRTNASPPAFLYVLYYDDTLSRYSFVPRFLCRGTNPYSETSPYPAIYFNTRYSLGIAKNEILLHEAGHLLGLVNRPTRARGDHCLDWSCLMNTGRGYLLQFRWLPGMPERPLCAACVAESRQRSSQPPPSKLRYVGAVLLRSETGYHVASLPDRLGVLVGSCTEQDCEEFFTATRLESPGAGGDGTRLYCRVKEDALKDPAKLSDILNRIKADPIAVVRQSAPKLLLRECAGQYCILGQYSNAVDTLHQALLSDAKDEKSYNQLAWIKATCSDASVRDGNDAVSAASKACELSQWKDWSYIDTLAAAYAEAGDFKRAVEFQEQALRTGLPPERDLKNMQARLSLYKQSRPFREKEDKP